MSVSYFKRLRMEIHLPDPPEVPELPPGYFWVAWSPELLATHAELLSRSFHGQIDTIVFPSLSSEPGCLDLMQRMAAKPTFAPESTWLVATAEQYCGTIQGLVDNESLGAIQNVGVIDLHRGRGLGRALLMKALEGFHRLGLRDAFLEVTAENASALAIYERLGFRQTKTLYKAVQSTP